MRILLSSAGPIDGQVGGGQVYVQNLALELSRRGHPVAIISQETGRGISPNGPLIVRRDFQGIPVYGLLHWERRHPCRPLVAVLRSLCSLLLKLFCSLSSGGRPPGLRGLGASLFSPLPPVHALQPLTDILRDFRPDVVHLNGLMAPLVRVCREQRVPHVATAHHPGEACPNGTLLSPGDTICQEAPRAETCVPCICRRKKGGGILAETLARIPPWLYRPAGSFLNHFQNVTYAGRVLMQPWLIEKQLEELRYFHQHAQLLIAPSKNMAQTLIRSGVAADRVMLVPHGIRPLANVPLRPFGSRPVRFGFVGRIDHAKGVHILLQAWDKIPKTLDSELHIIGDAQTLSDKAAFERALTACQDRSRLILHGKLAHPDTLQEMARLDVIILPSICPESFGLVILEAFSLGRPVIVTNCGGPAELVRDGIDGLVVEPNNPSALARALERLAACPAAIIQMAKNLRPVRTLEDHVRDLELLYASARSEAASLGAPASLPALSIQIL